MTRGELGSYRGIQAEIGELRYKLLHLGENDSLIGNDVVMDYRSGYPVPQPVVGYDFDRERELRARYEARLKCLRKKGDEIEDYVEGLQDSLTRRIFRMYFLEGMSQAAVAKRIHMSQAAVSNKISDFFKVAHN